MKKFSDWVEKGNEKSFIDCTTTERITALQELEDKKVDDEEIASLLNHPKSGSGSDAKEKEIGRAHV